jgi:signal transduction histidine kinase
MDRARGRDGSGGAGIGLALSAAVAHIQSGEIAIVGGTGRGTTVRLTLPAASETPG